MWVRQTIVRETQTDREREGEREEREEGREGQSERRDRGTERWIENQKFSSFAGASSKLSVLLLE